MQVYELSFRLCCSLLTDVSCCLLTVPVIPVSGVVAEWIKEGEIGETVLSVPVIRFSITPVVVIMVSITGCTDPPLMVVMWTHHSPIPVALLFVDEVCDEFVLLTTMSFIQINQPGIMERANNLGILLGHHLVGSTKKDAVNNSSNIRHNPTIRTTVCVLAQA